MINNVPVFLDSDPDNIVGYARIENHKVLITMDFMETLNTLEALAQVNLVEGIVLGVKYRKAVSA
jgi:hypothetical protein